VQLNTNYIMKYRSNILSNTNYYALGEARLERTESSLRLTNLTNSGLDGIIIDVDGADEFELNFTPFEIKERNSFNVSHIGIDEWGRLKTIGQQSIYFNPNTKQVEVAFNSRLLSKNGLLLQALQGDQIVFQGHYPLPIQDTRTNWWPVVAAAVWVISKVDYEYKSKDGGSHEVSFNKKSIKGRNRTHDGVEFYADNFLCTSKGILQDNAPLIKMKAVQITAINYSELEIVGGKIVLL